MVTRTTYQQGNGCEDPTGKPALSPPPSRLAGYHDTDTDRSPTSGQPAARAGSRMLRLFAGLGQSEHSIAEAGSLPRKNGSNPTKHQARTDARTFPGPLDLEPD
jgi:hypothetical protein